MKIKETKDSIWSVITNFVGIPVVWADQKFDRIKLLQKSGSYCTVKLIAGPLKVGANVELVSGSKMQSFGNRNMTFSVNIYGENAINTLSNLHDLMMSSVFRHMLHFEGVQYGIEIAIIDTPNIQNLSELMQTNFEERLQLDFRVRVVSLAEFDIELIENVSSDPNSGYDRYEGDPNRINETL